MPTRVYLFNDTSLSRHAGCKAVMRSLRHQLSTQMVIATHYVGKTEFYEDALATSDVVIVNGEGSIHHDSRRANFLLEALRKAQAAGKKTALINALYEQYDDQYRDVLERLDFLSVRETRSAEFARRHGGDPVVLLDSAADPRFLEGRGNVVKKLGPLAKGSTHPHAETHGMLDDLDAPHLGLADVRYEDLVATLKTTEVYVTGQHHGVYAAAIAGIPFVPLTSNSHKIEGFIEWSGLPIPLCKSADQLEQHIEQARAQPQLYRKLRDFVASQRVFGLGDLQRIMKLEHENYGARRVERIADVLIVVVMVIRNLASFRSARNRSSLRPSFHSSDLSGDQ